MLSPSIFQGPSMPSMPSYNTQGALGNIDGSPYNEQPLHSNMVVENMDDFWSVNYNTPKEIEPKSLSLRATEIKANKNPSVSCLNPSVLHIGPSLHINILNHPETSILHTRDSLLSTRPGTNPLETVFYQYRKGVSYCWEGIHQLDTTVYYTIWLSRVF